jgi:hypothetical protein
MPFDPDTGLIRHDPTCRSMNSAKLHPSDDGSSAEHQGILLSDNSHGWCVPVAHDARDPADNRSHWAWKEKIYLVAREPGSLLSFPFTIAESAPYLPPLDDGDGVHHDNEGKIGFEPLPLAMRPNAPYNVQPMGVVVDQLGRRRKRSAKDVKGRAADELSEAKRAEKRQYPEVDEIIDGARVMIGFQQSATLGLGSVYCWVDDDRSDGTRVDGWWEIEERNMGM